MSQDFDFDLFVIGGGSGGVRAARLAATMGKKVGIADESRFGGTCVIRGCVPKKLFVYASHLPDELTHAQSFGWSVPESHFDWRRLVAAKDNEISRLEGLYLEGLKKAGAETFHSRAELIGPNCIRLLSNNREVTARHILIATGARPNLLPDLPGHEFCVTSDDMFDLPELPSSAVIVGGGYIAVEFASILHGLGVNTTIACRGPQLLRGFDSDLSGGLQEAMMAKGIDVIVNAKPTGVEKAAHGKRSVYFSDGTSCEADLVLLAVGRQPNTSGLGTDKAGVETDARGAVIVDDYGVTTAPGIYAIGDVSNREHLTPVAIHEAMCLIDTLYADRPRKPDRAGIATGVFSQPEIGTVGLTEFEATDRLTHVDVYRTSFRPMKSSLSRNNHRMLMKLVVDGDTGTVVGAHILGEGAAEMAQLLAVAIKAGATKADFDMTMAVHPTASEELVTMYVPTYSLERGQMVS